MSCKSLGQMTAGTWFVMDCPTQKLSQKRRKTSFWWVTSHQTLAGNVHPQHLWKGSPRTVEILQKVTSSPSQFSHFESGGKLFFFRFLLVGFSSEKPSTSCCEPLVVPFQSGVTGSALWGSRASSLGIKIGSSAWSGTCENSVPPCKLGSSK